MGPMSYRRLRLLIVFFAAAWLPFSAVAAVTMPFCIHGHPGSQGPDGAEYGQAAGSLPGSRDHAGPAGHGDCHEHAATPAGTAGAQDGMACDQCGFCHLACAGMIPSEAAATADHPAAHVLAGLTATLHSDPLPEPLRRPPRSL